VDCGTKRVSCFRVSLERSLHYKFGTGHIASQFSAPRTEANDTQTERYHKNDALPPARPLPTLRHYPTVVPYPTASFAPYRWMGCLTDASTTLF
jgi:hypothetical protein